MATKVVGLSAAKEMKGRKTRSWTVSVSPLKPFCRRSLDLAHPIRDEFAQITWSANLGLNVDLFVAAPMYTLFDRKQVGSGTGAVCWEYRARVLDGVSLDWVTEAGSLDSFNPLQLLADDFHALTPL